jgi:hypothetical protein
MALLDVWQRSEGKIVLCAPQMIPNGAVEHPEEWTLLGYLEVRDAAALSEDPVQEAAPVPGSQEPVREEQFPVREAASDLRQAG